MYIKTIFYQEKNLYFTSQ